VRGPTVSTGHGARRTISSATEPSKSFPNPPRPRVPRTRSMRLYWIADLSIGHTNPRSDKTSVFK
jgi:hypothetical protein